MCRSSFFWSGSNSDRNTTHGEDRPSAASKSSVSRIPPNYAIRRPGKPRNHRLCILPTQNSDEPSKLAHALVKVLKSEMENVSFFMSEEIEKGDEWRKQIETKIRAS